MGLDGEVRSMPSSSIRASADKVGSPIWVVFQVLPFGGSFGVSSGDSMLAQGRTMIAMILNDGNDGCGCLGFWFCFERV